MINGHEINGAEINGSAADLTTVINYLVADAVEPFTPITVHAVDPFDLFAPVEIVAHEFDTVGQAINWSVSVTLGGVDYSARLTGRIRIERQINAAALADLSLVPVSGPIDPTAFDGQSITIRYTDERGSSLIFSGVVIRSSIDMNEGVLNITCSDLLQERVDELSRGQIDALIDHARADAVYRDPAGNWDYAQQCLKSAEGDFFRSVSGSFRFVPWSVSPSITHNDAAIFDGTLTPSFEDRHTLVNRVNIEFDWRHLFGWHRVHKLHWGVGLYYHVWVVSAFSSTPPREMIESAIPSGLVFASAVYEDLPPTGVYSYKGSTSIFNRLSPGYFAYSFDIEAAERWLQTVSRKLSISVSAQSSIARYGEIFKTETYAIDSRESAIDWHETTESGDLLRGLEFGTQMGSTDSGFRTGDRAEPPEGEDVDVYASFGSTTYRVPLYGDQNTLSQSGNAVLCALREARKKILESHQNVSVRYDVPMNPLLQLADGIDLDATRVKAQGRVTRLEHNMDFDSGEVLTALTITPYANVDSPSLTAPEWSAIVPEQSDVESVPMTSHFGYLGVDPLEPDESWRGYVGNLQGHDTYPESFTVEIPEVHESLRENLEVEQSAAYSISLQLDKITLSL